MQKELEQSMEPIANAIINAMTYEELKKEVDKEYRSAPDYIRYGQFVFNYIDEKYDGLGRRIIESDRSIDPFYRDDVVIKFLEACVPFID